MTKSSSGNLASLPTPEIDLTNHAAVQGIFNDTKCYDLMQTSAKVRKNAVLAFDISFISSTSLSDI